MKNILLISVVLFVYTLTHSQTNNAPELKFGEYSVDYRDTIIQDSAELYQYESINIPKPYFTHIWYPCETKSSDRKMKYEQYWKFSTDSIENYLIKRIRELYNIQAFKSTVTPDVLLSQTVNVNENAPLIKVHSEVILYHHGSQGVGIENYRLCEYLASHGYVVISPNFTLPSDIVPKLIPSTEFKNKYDHRNLTPEVMASIQLDMNNAELENIDFILKYIRLNHSNDIVGIGHSRGAQRLMLSDKDSTNRMKKIIALHTTYEEDKTHDVCNIRPYDCSIIDKNLNNFNTPKFFFAHKFYKDSLLTPPNYEFYDRFSNSTYCQINKVIEHNSYVYDWLVYHRYQKKIPKDRIEQYYLIIKTCLDIIQNNELHSNEYFTIFN